MQVSGVAAGQWRVMLRVMLTLNLIIPTNPTDPKPYPSLTRMLTSNWKPSNSPLTLWGPTKIWTLWRPTVMAKECVVSYVQTITTKKNTKIQNKKTSAPFFWKFVKTNWKPRLSITIRDFFFNNYQHWAKFLNKKVKFSPAHISVFTQAPDMKRYDPSSHCYLLTWTVLVTSDTLRGHVKVASAPQTKPVCNIHPPQPHSSSRFLLCQKAAVWSFLLLFSSYWAVVVVSLGDSFFFFFSYLHTVSSRRVEG